MSKAWFAPKRVGYGSSLPISWEGWAVLVAFFAGIWGVRVLAFRMLAPDVARLAWLAGVFVLIAALILIARAKTEGGWRWRSGS